MSLLSSTEQASGISPQADGLPEFQKKKLTPSPTHALLVLWDSPLCGLQAGTLGFPPRSYFCLTFFLNDTLGATCSNSRDHLGPLSTELQGLPNKLSANGRAGTHLSKRLQTDL